MDLGTDFTEILKQFDAHTTEEFWYPKEAVPLYKTFKRETPHKLSESELNFLEFEIKLIGGEMWGDIIKKHNGDSLAHFWPDDESNQKYAELRLEKSSNILHKARYSYYLWCKTKNHKIALESAQYFRKAALQHQSKDPDKYYKQIEFCFEIALKIYKILGNSYRENGLDISNELLSILQADFEKQRTMGFFLSKVSILLDALDFAPNSADTRKTIAKETYGLLEKCSEFHATNGNFYLERSCIEKQIKLLDYGAAGNKETLDKKMIVSLEKEGDRGYPFIGMSFYQDAIRYLTEKGMTWEEKRNGLESKLSKARQDSVPYYKTVSMPVEIPDEVIAQALSEFNTLSPEVALENFLNSNNYIPSLASARSSAAEVSKAAPVYSLFNKTVSKDGFNSSNLNSEEYEVNSQFSLMCQFNENLLVNRICEMNFFKKEFVIEWINKSTNFDANNKELIAEAINEYFESRFSCSSPLLVLRIEPSVREIARLVGITPKKIRSDTQDIFDAQLGGLLIDERIESLLGEEFITYFKVKFSDPRYQNYRNRVGHGHISKSELTKGLSNVTIFALLKLAKINVVQ